MTAVQPFGNLQDATILVIGHDPRLQNSQAEAKTAFFLDYLLRPRPGRTSEARKYDLANALVGYISDLAGREIPLQTLYVTNLCNQFLSSTKGQGTILISDDLAEKGAMDIGQAISAGHFKLILPLSLQVCYHLGRLRFFDETDERIQTFVHQARPSSSKAASGIYLPVGTAPFLDICGQRLSHRGISVVPVLHVKQWPLRAQMKRYAEPMEKAKQEIRRTIGE
jgi:hypothetical protein